MTESRKQLFFFDGKQIPVGSAAGEEDRVCLGRQLSAILNSRNVVILTGLGPSLAYKDAAGNVRGPTRSSLLTAVVELQEYKNIASKVFPEGLSSNDVEMLLSRCQLYAELNEGTGDGPVTLFLNCAGELIRSQCDFINDSDELKHHQEFLRRVARRSGQLPRVQIFTTNYDRCFERAAANAGFHVIDGFTFGPEPSFDSSVFDMDFVQRDGQTRPDYIPNVIQLMKLHGSVDWSDSGNGQIIRSRTPVSPILIYPHTGKFRSSYRRPYFDLMTRYQSALQKSDLGLLVIGYGFGDDHINSSIWRALRTNVSMRMMVCDIQLQNQSVLKPESVFTQLINLTLERDPRLSLLGTVFSTLPQLIPDLHAASEQEEHFRRVAELLSKVSQ